MARSTVEQSFATGATPPTLLGSCICCGVPPTADSM
jgi:hypothetical protein